jgi:hypothetical protein
MVVIYRLQGLDGEATEEIVESLPDDAGQEKDPEEEFKLTAVMSECGGLQALIRAIDRSPTSPEAPVTRTRGPPSRRLTRAGA